MILPLVVSGSVLLALCWLLWQLLRQNGRILLRLDELDKRLNELEFGEGQEPAGLPVGAEAPAFELPDLTGAPHSLAQFRGQPLLLLFFNPACGFCRELAPKLNELAASRKQNAATEALPQPHVLILSTGDAEANRALFAEPSFSFPVLLQQQMEVAAAYQANGTPSGYRIDGEGKIASELAMGADALLKLLESSADASAPDESGIQKPTADPADETTTLASNGHGHGDGRAERFRTRSLTHSKIKRDGLKAGTAAPEFRLPRLDGRGDLALSELRGRRVLLVFSSPTCGPCVSLAPHLQKFHRQHPEFEVVMISKGEPKENRAKIRQHGLTFPVVLQQQWEISRRYAMFATPVAYLVDEAGVITHDAAVGTDAILQLLAGQEAPVKQLELVALAD